MILLCGLPNEPPIARVRAALDDLGTPYVMVDQREHAQIGLRLRSTVAEGEVGGELSLGDLIIDLSTVRGIYIRLYGEETFPQFDGLPSRHPERLRFRRFVALLTDFADICPGVVFNRSQGMTTNHSKGFQAQLIRAAGFEIPRTLITNNADTAEKFIEMLWSEGRETVFKSVSSIRSIVRTVSREDLKRLQQIRACPVQFQEKVEGIDHRIHVINETTIATSIVTTGTDYRYAAMEEGGASELAAVDLPPSVAMRCVRLAGQLGLGFAGVDLRHTKDGRWVCFEVNPSPAFSFYQNQTGQPIAEAVARCLIGDIL